MGFAPDLNPNTPGILLDSSNLYPTAAGVGTLPVGVAQIAAEGSAAQTIGVFSMFGYDGTWRVVKGTRQHIFHSVSPFTAWTEWDSSQTYTAPAGALWSFCGHGNDMYASNGTDVLQKSTGASGQFTALTASVGSVAKGQFNIIAEPGGLGWFLMVLGLASNGTGWATSGVSDDTDWGFDVATLGATGFLDQTPGAITGAAPLRGGVVAYKATSLYQGTFAGPPFVWNFVITSAQIGTVAPLSIVQLGDTQAFLGPDDFYLYDGYSPRAIPNELREYFFKTANPNALNTVQGRFDAARNFVAWHYAIGSSTTLTDYILWSRRSGRWTHGKLSVWMVYPGNVPRSATTTDLVPAYIDTTGALDNYPPNPATTGTTATLTTWDFGADDDALLAVMRCKPHWKTRPTGAQSLSTIVKQFPGTTGAAGLTAASQDSQDYLNLVQAARWQNLVFSFAGDAEIDSIGIDAEFAGYQ